MCETQEKGNNADKSEEQVNFCSDQDNENTELDEINPNLIQESLLFKRVKDKMKMFGIENY